jgi:RNA polymerase sigma-70 factor (ECF subfamily)
MEGDGLADLLVRAAAGDTAAFSAVYAETAPRAFGLALRVVGDRARAEQVTQEAYLTLWRTAAEFDARRGSCRSWILALVHRTAVDHLRSTGPATPGREAGQDATLDRVSTPERQALELSYFDGRTHREVAGLLGLSPGTVSSRIRDGLVQLARS